jgi:TPR repeat protein
MPLSKQANAKRAAKKRTEANAKKGDINAQFNLAFRYLHGEGCEVNSSKARYWFQEAANHGDADAQFNLGIMLKEAGDAAAAQQWFQEAGAQGIAWAQHNFDLMSRGGGTSSLSAEEIHTEFIFTHRKEKGPGSGSVREGFGGAQNWIWKKDRSETVVEDDRCTTKRTSSSEIPAHPGYYRMRLCHVHLMRALF